MPSPFPGMNPYLEQPGMWRDFHEGYIQKLRAALLPQVAGRYAVKVEETFYLKDIDFDLEEKWFYPDVAVLQQHTRGTPAAAGTATLPRAVPTMVELNEDLQEIRLSHIEFRDRKDRALRTVIELLSPANKSGTDREGYLFKRRQLIAGGVNVVEIDFHRIGGRLVPGIATCDYCIATFRTTNRRFAEVIPLQMADPLPRIPIPLAPDEVEPVVELQTLFHSQYDEAYFDGEAYLSGPVPPLTPEQAAWASQFVPPRPAP